MKKYSRLRAVIDLDAVMYNMEMMHANIEKGTKMVVVIKTDGYGHGAVPISRMLEDVDYVWGYAVATLDEGVVLRKAGIQKPILCLGCIFPDQLEESVEEILKIGRLVYTDCEGMFTHFSKADETDKTTTLEQIRAFLWMKEHLAAEGMEFTYYHCANSASIIDMPKLGMNLERAGISTYGLYPSDEVNKEAVPLRPAMELIAHVTYVKWIEKGTEVSYGGTFVAPKRMQIATIPTGYGDGYPRSLSNKGYVLIHGQKAPILGRVCMDQFMVDVTGIPDVKFGDRATLVGHDGDAYLSIDELANLSGRFNYEFICDINKRVPREYLRDGKVVEQVDYF